MAYPATMLKADVMNGGLLDEPIDLPEDSEIDV
jgi:hypothetical protein